MAPSPGDRHVDKHSSGRKKKSRRVPGGSSRLAVSGQPPVVRLLCGRNGGFISDSDVT